MNRLKFIIEELFLQKKENKILEDISLEFHVGVSYLLYGRNGAGKSSLLKCLAGIEKNYKGNIYGSCAGNNLPAMNVRKAYLPENIDIPNQIKVKDYIDSFIKIYTAQGRYDKDLHQLLNERFNINSFVDQYFGELSKGMQKLVLITIVLMSCSDLIVLDEPFEGLDLISKEELLNVLLQITANGCIVVLSSHEVARMNTKFDCLISMKEGRITNIRDKQKKPTYEEMLSFI